MRAPNGGFVLKNIESAIPRNRSRDITVDEKIISLFDEADVQYRFEFNEANDLTIETVTELRMATECPA